MTDASVLGAFIDITPFGANFPSIGFNQSGTAANANTPVNRQLFGCPAQCQLEYDRGAIFPSNFTQVTNGVTYTGPSCNVAAVGVQCQTGGVDPNFKHTYVGEWNLDIQQAITNKLTLDVAYVGNHGYDEEAIRDLNQPPLGTGWAGAPTAACLASAPAYNNCKVSAAQELAAEPYSAKFPYLTNIDVATNGDFSNYDALQVTFQGRNYHGLSFLSAYTWSHALSVSDGNSVNTSNLIPTDSTNLLLNYGNGAMDLRHRFTFSPTYQIPGLKSPGQMLEGWSVNALVTVQSGFPWNPSDTTTFDWLGTGENGELRNRPRHHPVLELQRA